MVESKKKKIDYVERGRIAILSACVQRERGWDIHPSRGIGFRPQHDRWESRVYGYIYWSVDTCGGGRLWRPAVIGNDKV